MWKQLIGKPCESIVILFSALTLINSFVHFVLSCLHNNVHCLPFALFATLLSGFIVFVYIMSFLGYIDKYVKRLHLTIVTVISIFLVVITIYFIIAYFSLAVRFMSNQGYSFGEVATKYHDSDQAVDIRLNYWPVVTCLWMIFFSLCFLLDLTRRQFIKTPNNSKIQVLANDRNASIVSYYDM